MAESEGERLDLSFLDSEEADKILRVLQRDEQLRNTEKQRVRKLQGKKKDGKWLHAASGEWFEEIQKEKYKEERDVRSLVRQPLSCRLQETSPLTESVDSKMSRLEKSPSSKNVNSGPSFLGIRSPFSFFGKFSKQNTKLQERNDIFPQTKGTRNEEKKKAEFFHSTRSVRQTIKFFETIGKKTKEHKVPLTHAEIEKEAFEVLGELDKKLAQEKGQQAKNNRSATSLWSDSHPKDGGSLHNMPKPRTECSTLYFQEKPQTVSISEGYRTCATYLAPRHQLSQNNKVEKSPSLCSAVSSKAPSSAPSAGTFSAKSLPPLMIEKNSPEQQKNRFHKPRRPPISSVNWNMVPTLDHSEKHHSVFRTQSDMDLTNPNRMYELYRNRNSHREPEFNKVNTTNVNAEVFHNKNILSEVQKTHNGLFRTQSDLDLSSHNDSSKQNRIYKLYKFKNKFRLNNNDSNNANSVKTLKSNCQVSPTGVHKSDSSVSISGKNIEEGGNRVWEQEDKENAFKSTEMEPKHFPVPSSKKYHRKPMETECGDKGTKHSTRSIRQSNLAIEATLNTNGSNKHKIPCDMQANTAKVIQEDLTVGSERSKTSKELSLDETDSAISHLAHNIQEQKQLGLPLSDKPECDMKVNARQESIEPKSLPLPEVLNVVPQSRMQHNTLHSGATHTNKEATSFINLNIDTNFTEPVRKTITPENTHAIEVFRNCAAQDYKHEDQMIGGNIYGFHSDALRTQIRNSSSLPDLSDWREKDTIPTHLKSTDFNLGNIHFSINLGTASINRSEKPKEPLLSTNISRDNIQAVSDMTCGKQEKCPTVTSQRLAQLAVQSCNVTTKSTTEQSEGMRTVSHTRDPLQEEMPRTIHQNELNNIQKRGQGHSESSVKGIIMDFGQKKADNNNNRQSRIAESSHNLMTQDRTSNHITNGRQFDMGPGKGVLEQTHPQIHSALVTNDYQIFNSQDNNGKKKESLYSKGIVQSRRGTPSSANGVPLSFQTITSGQSSNTENLAKPEIKTKSNFNQNLINNVHNKYAITEGVHPAKLSESSVMSPFYNQSEDLPDDICNMSISPPITRNVNLVKQHLTPSPEVFRQNITSQSFCSATSVGVNSVTTCSTNYPNSCTSFSFSTVFENTKVYNNRGYVLSDIEKTEYHKLVTVYNSLPHQDEVGLFPEDIRNKVQALEFNRTSSDQLENIIPSCDEFDERSSYPQQDMWEPSSPYNIEHIPLKQGLMSFSDEESLSYDIEDRLTDLPLSQGHPSHFHSGSPTKHKWDFYYTLPSRRSHQRDFGKRLQKHSNLHCENNIYSPDKAEPPIQTSPDHSFDPNFWKDNLDYSPTLLASYEKDNINNLINSDNLIRNQNASHCKGVPQDKKLSPLNSKETKVFNPTKLKYSKISSSPSIEPLMQNQANFSKVSEMLHRNKPPYCPEYIQNKMKALTDTRRFLYSCDDTGPPENEFSSLPSMEQFDSSTRMNDGTNSPYVFYSMNDKYQNPLDPQLQEWGDQTNNQHSNLHRSKSLKGLNVGDKHELTKQKTDRRYSSKSTGGMLSNVRPSVCKDVHDTKYNRQLSHDLIRDENHNCPSTTTSYPHKPVYTSKSLDYGIFGEEQQKAFLDNVKRALTEGRLWRPCFLKNPGFLRSDAHQHRNSQGPRYHSDGDSPYLLCPQGFLNIYEDEAVNRSDPETDTTTDDEYYLDDLDRETEL
eukprot:XP_002934985.1 PREDICTED: exophilin-5 isoform X1 [Xenopus tropicalis]